MPPAPPPARLLADLLDPARDLLLGSRCLGCERPGRLVCVVCRALLQPRPAPSWPTPVPPGLVDPWAALPYDGLVRDLVLGLKEHALLALAQPLGDLLAATVAAALHGTPADTVATVLVPVPSRAGTVRARGHDAVGAVTRRAALGLQTSGSPGPVLVAPLLRLRPGVVDQSGLDARARRTNLDGSMACAAPALRRLARTTSRGATPRVRVVVCDDVITTGSTLREAQRALEAVGLVVVASAAVAATQKRTAHPPGGHGPDSRRNFR